MYKKSKTKLDNQLLHMQRDFLNILWPLCGNQVVEPSGTPKGRQRKTQTTTTTPAARTLYHTTLFIKHFKNNNRGNQGAVNKTRT